MQLVPVPMRLEDWPEIAREMGLSGRILLHEDPLEVILMIDQPVWGADKGNLTMEKHNYYLRSILKNMLEMAIKFPGRAQRRELKNGLKIDVLVGHQDGVTKLQLSRNYVWPSATEYATVLNAWPYDLPLDLEPVRQAYNDRCYLKCTWKTSDWIKE